MKYNNPIKQTARGWSWNRICERIKSKDARRRARVFCLIGDTTKELEAAKSKGFSLFNVIGVDIRPEPVKAWREAGGLAVQAPLECVLALSKYSPQAVIADFCGGLTEKSFNTMVLALARTEYPGCVVINLLRGRDHIDKFRMKGLNKACDTFNKPELKQLTKKRSILVMYELFHRIYGPQIFSEIEETESLTKQQFRKVDELFETHWKKFVETLSPDFYDYKSADSNQYFDSLALNATGYPSTPEQVMNSGLFSLIKDYDIQLAKRRMAALEAVRTKELNKMKSHYIEKYQPLNS